APAGKERTAGKCRATATTMLAAIRQTVPQRRRSPCNSAPSRQRLTIKSHHVCSRDTYRIRTMRAKFKFRLHLGRGYAPGARRSMVSIISPALVGVSILLVALMPTQAQTLRTYVSGAGNDAGPCTVSSPCQTLQAALLKTAPGGEIKSLD